MKSVAWIPVVLLILAAALAGCTSQAPAPAATTAATPVPVTPVETPAAPALPDNLAGSWQVTTMAIQGGTAILEPTAAITLTFNSDGTVTGNGGCNNYNGPFTLTGAVTEKGSGLSIGPLTSTKMYCQDTSSQEGTYLDLLGKAMAYDVDTKQLTITDSDANVLIFQRPSTIPAVTEGMLPA
jgi:heat shock protein HslJ